ncbi:hypothetical protein M408DRAFT_29933 [Serendipita vermifera MAFF 305830]|uniref:NAD(P)-binding protein n=1 Tax=Serendipita vermifera MAFF 305830 TaxID=933852 RepID=A0A0C3ANU9_SERVB|nr:hypothetical protein M408DRAFT_29933 [Serendipita vermifera MAFF 305830]
MSGFLSSLNPARAVVPLAQASNALFKPEARPVALFFGGTSGIGQAMAEQFAKQTDGRAQIVLLGRNQEAANKIISSFPHTPAGTLPAEESKYSFVKVDATSMAEVRDVASKLSKELEKINFIVLSAGFLNMKGREETSEGIDRKLACQFYARFRFTYDLLPLLEKAQEKGERTGVISILGAGKGAAIDLKDLGLVKTHSFSRALSYPITCTDAAFEELATRHPKIPFTHAFPGTVLTPLLKNITGARFFVPLIRPLLVTPEECAQIMWWRMWAPESEWKAGAHQINNCGEEVPHNRFVTPEVKAAVCEHAVQVTSGASK